MLSGYVFALEKPYEELLQKQRYVPKHMHDAQEEWKTLIICYTLLEGISKIPP